MGKTTAAEQTKTLTPDSKELRRALTQAAQQGQRLAQAFGLQVPSVQNANRSKVTP